MYLDLVFNEVNSICKLFDVGLNVVHLCVVSLQQDSNFGNGNVYLIQVLGQVPPDPNERADDSQCGRCKGEIDHVVSSARRHQQHQWQQLT